MQVQRITTHDLDDWSQVGDQRIYVNDLIDQASQPDARMTVGYAATAAGEKFEIAFPYDEVLVITKGAFTVTTEEGVSVTARAGEVIYLPANSANSHTAEEDTEMVYVANPPDVYARHVAEAAGDE